MTLPEQIVSFLLEGPVSGSPVDVDAIVKILTGPGNIASMNQALAPYNVVIEEVPDLENTGASGGYDGNRMVISPNKMRFLRSNPDYLHLLITHEMVHKAQADRIRAAGKDPQGIMGKIAARYQPTVDRPIDVATYTEEPVEAMALAKNAVDKLQGYGHSQSDINKILRQGGARQYSPVPITGKGKRFHQYAYKYANPEA